MSKILQKVLQDFKRGNTAAKQRMATKFGFSTPEKFHEYLLKEIGDKATEVSEPKVTEKPKVEEAPTDMVIAFDTTGSMRTYIAAVRKHVQKTIGDLFENVPNLKLKIVAFGDYCDMRSPKEFGNAYQETELTDDKTKLIQFVQDAKDTGGGDTEEFYELVLHKIIDETPWRGNANKAILLIADCEPHPVGYTLHPWVKDAQLDWKEEAKKASRMLIKIDTLRIIPGTQWYAELSRMTKGSCMDFKSADKTHELIAGATYMSSMSEKGIMKAKSLYRSALVRGDDELVGAYKGMAESRSINLDD